jgi:hypothetical protein
MVTRRQASVLEKNRPAAQAIHWKHPGALIARGRAAHLTVVHKISNDDSNVNPHPKVFFSFYLQLLNGLIWVAIAATKVGAAVYGASGSERGP